MKNPYEDNSEYSRDLEIEMQMEQQKIAKAEKLERYIETEPELDEPRLRALLIV